MLKRGSIQPLSEIRIVRSCFSSHVVTAHASCIADIYFGTSSIYSNVDATSMDSNAGHSRASHHPIRVPSLPFISLG